MVIIHFYYSIIVQYFSVIFFLILVWRGYIATVVQLNGSPEAGSYVQFLLLYISTYLLCAHFYFFLKTKCFESKQIVWLAVVNKFFRWKREDAVKVDENTFFKYILMLQYPLLIPQNNYLCHGVTHSYRSALHHIETAFVKVA